MNKEGLGFIVIILALLMWYSNADLFIRLDAMQKTMSFGIYALDIFLALAFSTLTAFSVRHLEDYKYVKWFATFDAVGIFLHFQSEIPPTIFNWIGSIFFGLLMFFTVSMIFVLSDIIRKRETAKKMQTKPEQKTPAPAVQTLPEPAPQIKAIEQPKTDDEIHVIYMSYVHKINGKAKSPDFTEQKKIEFINTCENEIARKKLIQKYINNGTEPIPMESNANLHAEQR